LEAKGAKIFHFRKILRGRTPGSLENGVLPVK
jgi:hypothetical protein